MAPAILFLALILAGSGEVDRLVPLPNGRRLHLSCSGAGAPTVILESGLGLPMAAWSKVRSRLAPHARVCTYERAGYGTSDAGPAPRDAEHVAGDLEALTKAAGLPAPYVLVGHSLGADFVRLFAAQHPREVVGIVLVDPVFRGNERKLAIASPETGAAIAKGDQIIETCVGAIAKGRIWNAADPRYAVCGPPPPVGSPLADRKMAQATLSEFNNQETSDAQAASSVHGRLTIPMIVLTAKGRRTPASPAAQELIAREHAAIARTSARGLHRVVEDSGHVIQNDQPEAVAQAVDEVIAMARSSK